MCLQTHGKVRIVSPLTPVFFLPCAGKESVPVSAYPLSWSKAKACYGLYIVQKSSQSFHKSFTFFHRQMVYIYILCIGIKSFISQWLQLKNKHPSITPCFFSQERVCNMLFQLITFALEIWGLYKPHWHEVFIIDSVTAYSKLRIKDNLCGIPTVLPTQRPQKWRMVFFLDFSGLRRNINTDVAEKKVIWFLFHLLLCECFVLTLL